MTSTHQHVIVTRFSVKARSDSPKPSLEWLRYRLQLMETYCLPALASQSCSDFRWLVLCDEETDPTCLERVRELLGNVPDGTLVLSSRSRSSLPAIVDLLDESAEILVTSRVDSDDALNTDFVARVRNYVAPFSRSDHEAILVNFSQGCKLDLESGALYDSYQPHSPYLTLLERRGPGRLLRTVHAGNHGFMHLSYSLHEDPTPASWLQLIHGGNVSNHIHAGDVPVLPGPLADRFAIESEVTVPPHAPLSAAPRAGGDLRAFSQALELALESESGVAVD